MREAPPSAVAEWPDLIANWATAWGCPGLEQRIQLSLSSRLRTSAGRCVPTRGEVRIAAFLLDGPASLLHEVLCHEVAHAAVHEIHGPAARPHGPEWRALMLAAGFQPRTRLPARSLEALPRNGRNARRMWEHRCPVCQVKRLAGRRVPQWRCAACRASGRSGALRITRIEPATSSSTTSAPAARARQTSARS